MQRIELGKIVPGMQCVLSKSKRRGDAFLMVPYVGSLTHTNGIEGMPCLLRNKPWPSTTKPQSKWPVCYLCPHRNALLHS